MSNQSIIGKFAGEYTAPAYITPQSMESSEEVDLSAGAADNFTWSAPFDLVLMGAYFYAQSEAVGNVLAGGTAAVVSVDYTPTGGARTEFAAITPAAIGQTLAVGAHREPSSDPTEVNLASGEPVHFEHKTQAVAGGGGSALGAGRIGIIFRARPSATS